MDQQIITSAEPVGAVDEPKLTVSQFQALLREAADLERAKRPIIIRDSRSTPDWAGIPAAVQAPTVPAGPDFGGRYPSPAEYRGLVDMAPLRPGVVVRHWGRPLGITGAMTMAAGAGAGVVTGTAAAPIVAILAGLLAIAGGVARGEREQQKENAR